MLLSVGRLLPGLAVPTPEGQPFERSPPAPIHPASSLIIRLTYGDLKEKLPKILLPCPGTSHDPRCENRGQRGGAFSCSPGGLSPFHGDCQVHWAGEIPLQAEFTSSALGWGQVPFEEA